MWNRRRWYAIHRWIGFAVSLQLLAWSVGGLIFSILPIDEVRGRRDSTPAAPSTVGADFDFAEAVSAAERHFGTSTFGRLVTEVRLGRTVMTVYSPDGDRLGAIDTERLERVANLSATEATEVAEADFAPSAKVTDVRLVTADPPLEYRGGPLPAFQVQFDNEDHTRLYVAAETGKVTARRNDQWRIFDFFWMLHIMDYSEREDFNHPLLTAFSALAVLSGLSGLLLHGMRTASKRRRKKASTTPPV